MIMMPLCRQIIKMELFLFLASAIMIVAMPSLTIVDASSSTIAAVDHRHPQISSRRTNILNPGHFYCSDEMRDNMDTAECGEPCPSGFDMECPFGKWCYGPQTQCTKLVSTKFCGTSYEDASSKCQRECSTGKHSECDVEQEESCYDGTSCDIESMSENRRGIPNPANHFCGRSFHDALNQCQSNWFALPCPPAVDKNGEQEVIYGCPQGQYCFGGLECTALYQQNTSKPTGKPSPPPTTPNPNSPTQKPTIYTNTNRMYCYKQWVADTYDGICGTPCASGLSDDCPNGQYCYGPQRNCTDIYTPPPNTSSPTNPPTNAVVTPSPTTKQIITNTPTEPTPNYSIVWMEPPDESSTVWFTTHPEPTTQPTQTQVVTKSPTPPPSTKAPSQSPSSKARTNPPTTEFPTPRPAVFKPPTSQPTQYTNLASNNPTTMPTITATNTDLTNEIYLHGKLRTSYYCGWDTDSIIEICNTAIACPMGREMDCPVGQRCFADITCDDEPIIIESAQQHGDTVNSDQQLLGSVHQGPITSSMIQQVPSPQPIPVQNESSPSSNTNSVDNPLPPMHSPALDPTTVSSAIQTPTIANAWNDSNQSGNGRCTSNDDCNKRQFCNQGYCGECISQGAQRGMGCSVDEICRSNGCHIQDDENGPTKCFTQSELDVDCTWKLSDSIAKCNIQTLECYSSQEAAQTVPSNPASSSSSSQSTGNKGAVSYANVGNKAMYTNPQGNSYFCGQKYHEVSGMCLRSKPCPGGRSTGVCDNNHGCFFVPSCATEYESALPPPTSPLTRNPTPRSTKHPSLSPTLKPTSNPTSKPINVFPSNSSNREDNGPPELFCASSMAVLEDSCASAQSCKNGPCPSNQFCFPYACAATISHANVAAATTSSPVSSPKPTSQIASVSQSDLQSSASTQIPGLVNGNILGKANTCLCGEAFLDPKAKVVFAGEEVSCHELESRILVKEGNSLKCEMGQSSYSTTCCVEAFDEATDEKTTENTHDVETFDEATDDENIVGPCNLCQSNDTTLDMKESAQVSYNGEVRTCLEVNRSLNTRREQSNQRCSDAQILLFEQCCVAVEVNSIGTGSPETYLWFTSAASSNMNSARAFRLLLIAGLLFMRSSFGGL